MSRISYRCLLSMGQWKFFGDAMENIAGNEGKDDAESRQKTSDCQRGVYAWQPSDVDVCLGVMCVCVAIEKEDDNKEKAKGRVKKICKEKVQSVCMVCSCFFSFQSLTCMRSGLYL